ncbi:lytic transglycosylase domain-containing protein [Brevibacillus gelatini]|uniref:lytic transglycosylase domain-containing protein n=1 Tax=Brevibacillus gelatini TaxID=1655277 RepID=UPI003D8188A8
MIGALVAMALPLYPVSPALEEGVTEGRKVVELTWEKEEQFQRSREFARVIEHYVPSLSRQTIELYATTIYEQAVQFDIDPVLVAAIIWQESRFRYDAVSTKGARGLMQVMPRTAKGMQVNPDKLFDPVVNMRTGVAYLSMLRKKYGDMRISIIAYNQGEGNVDQKRYRADYYTRVMHHYRKMSNLIKK